MRVTPLDVVVDHMDVTGKGYTAKLMGSCQHILELDDGWIARALSAPGGWAESVILGSTALKETDS